MCIMQTKIMEYRREIDGLRALAVLPVIFFHAGFETFGGGFVGVDVFFVISGYLITSVILIEVQAGTFSLIRFYERRVRRILPALFFVVALCIPFAWFLLLPSDMKEFSKSVLSVALYVSNHYFASVSGYFDTTAELKPLLHTWSLALEEQYYVIFPLVIVAMSRLTRRVVIYMLASIAVISLALSYAGAYSNPTGAFFLLPSRGWELLIGAFVAYILLYTNVANASRSVMQLASLLGLGLIVFAVFVFDKNTPFPSLYALVPTFGTALLILYARPTTHIGKLLGSKAFVSVGLISYSAYLLHHPIFSFVRHGSSGEPSAMVLLLLIMLNFILAYGSWRYVEQPFRRKEHISRRLVFIFAAMGSAALIAFGIAGIKLEGFINRYMYVVNSFPSYELSNKKLARESNVSVSSFVDNAINDPVKNSSADKLWFSSNSNLIKVLIVGNSHSKDLYNIFAMNKGLFEKFEFARYGIQISCFDAGRSNRFFESPNYKYADVIILSTMWDESRPCGEFGSGDFNGARNLAAIGRLDGKLIALSSNTLSFPRFGSMTLTDKYVYKAAAERLTIADTNGVSELTRAINRRHYELKDSSDKILETNERLKNMAKLNGLVYLNKQDYLCDQSEGICFGITHDFQKTVYDYGHYTLAGARLFGLRAHDAQWLRPIEDAFRHRVDSNLYSH